MQWRLRPFDADRIAALSRSAGVHPIVAHLLLNRGVESPAQVADFFETRLTGLHDPASLPGVVEAADRIVRAVRDRRKIVIYGDYDVDGVCGTSILWSCLRLAGADVDYYIPHRVDEGYGLNGDALRTIAREHRADLVVTVDCGISAVREAQLARELGIELIVTDHHTIGPELPGAAVVVHPRLEGSAYPFGELCGCGVAFKLAWQVSKSFGDGKKASPQFRDFLIDAIGLVAMATVADVMPIHGENRLLVRHGLAGMLRQPSEGLRALLGVSKLLSKKSLGTGHIGFGLAPRINAAGRLDRAAQAVEMLTTRDRDVAERLATALDDCNRQRQEVEKRMVDEAHELLAAAGSIGERGAIVLGREGWHPGVIGIVASRIMETYHRPTIIMALTADHGQGSARSITGFNLYEAIHACSDGLLAFGGHAAAAGLKLPRGLFEAFADRFDQHCRAVLAPEQLRKSTWADAEVPLGALTIKLVEAIEALEPHGIGNPKPLLIANQVQVLDHPKLMGDRQQHLKVVFLHGEARAEAVGWSMADRAKLLKPGTVCSILFTPEINDYNGRRTVQLHLKDFKVEEGAVRAQSA